jgi:hypothetical protein
MTLTVNRFELPNRSRSTMASIAQAVVVLQKLDTNLKISLYIDG